MSKEIYRTRTATRGLHDREGLPHRMPGQERRQQLISVAMRLFSKKGFNGTTTKEIAEAAGVNQAILFRHFPTKDELYAAILEHKSNTSRTDKWLEELKVLADRRDDEALFRAVISRTLEHGRRDRDFTRLMLFSALEGHELAQSFRNKRVRPVFNFLCEYIALRQSEKAFRAIEPGVVVRALFGIPTYHSQVLTLFNCRLLSIKDEDAAMSFTRLILDGVCIDSARRNNGKKRSKGTASSTGHTTRHG